MEEECVICFEKLELANVADLIPCGCFCVCRDCVEPLRVCPKCQDTLCINVKVRKLQLHTCVFHTIQVGRDDTVRIAFSCVAVALASFHYVLHLVSNLR